MKNLLKSKGINARQLGQMIGESKSTAHRMATGRYFARMMETCQKIYAATGITPNEIFDIPKKDVSENGK